MKTNLLKIIGYLLLIANLGFFIADIILDRGIVCEVVNGVAVAALALVFLFPKWTEKADRKIVDFWKGLKNYVKC